MAIWRGCDQLLLDDKLWLFPTCRWIPEQVIHRNQISTLCGLLYLFGFTDLLCYKACTLDRPRTSYKNWPRHWPPSRTRPTAALRRIDGHGFTRINCWTRSANGRWFPILWPILNVLLAFAGQPHEKRTLGNGLTICHERTKRWRGDLNAMFQTHFGQCAASFTSVAQRTEARR